MAERSAAELRGHARARAFRSQKMRQTPSGCAECRHFDICRGGCRKFWRSGGSGAPDQYLCQDMGYFLDERRPHLERMAAAIRARWAGQGVSTSR